ncbi:MAG TPA: beta-propeller domain-containing protein, partial [Polyangiaceae bacterium]|nr:beta-propeller domain-containing protein [Polyangiaceae bacterium]
MSGLLGCLLGSWACSDDPDAVPPTSGVGDSEFVSSVVGNGSVGRGSGGSGGSSAESAGNPTAPATNDNASNADTDGAQRAISEADILQLSGDRLYALSRYSGLTVIDVSNPASLRIEGVYRSAADPFEMYVDDGLVYAMYNGWYSYTCDDQGSCSWTTEARVQAIDTRNPADIRVLADLEVPG